MGSLLLGNLCSIGKLDKCDFTISYSKYTLIYKQIIWLLLALDKSDLGVDVLMDIHLVMGDDVNKG